MLKSLSVFFPAYNEAKNIEKTIKDAVKVLEELKLEYEIIVVDDGSSDNTAEVVEKLGKSNDKIRVIRHKKNLGYGSALKTGFREAKYPWVAFTDSDGQFDFSEISKLLQKSDEAGVILGYRLNRADPLLRKIFTFGWSSLANVLLQLHTKDYSCGFKLIKKEVFEKVQPLVGEEKVTQIELLVKAKRLGYKFAEVGVHHYPRIYGTPTGAKLSVVIKSILDLLKLWWEIKEGKKVFICVAGILCLAAFLRFYRLSDYMTFLGDEGRDAIIVKELLVNHNLPFIGPPTSVGNIYLGPLYYYMMAASMGIFWLNPVAAAGMVAAIGVLIVGLIYFLGKAWFGKTAGLISAFLYAISPVTITYSKSSWNPNPVPFFALVGTWGFYKVHTSKNFLWLILVGVSAGAALNMHYLALILVPVFGVMWIYTLLTGRDLKNFWIGTLLGVISFWLVMLPLVLFDFKHNFLNYRAITALFSGGASLGFNPVETFSRIPGIYFHDLVGRYMTGENLILATLVGLLILVPLKNIKRWPNLFLAVWLIVGLLGLSLYKSNIYDHYLGFLNPVPYLLLGASFTYFKRIKIGWIILIIILAWINFSKSPILNRPNYQLERTQGIAKFIINESSNRPFNFALIAKNNYDSAYQYYLDLYGYKPQMVPFEVADQLFVVCEEQECDPTHHSKYEIVGFGWSKVESEKEVLGVKIYKLVHNPQGKP